MRQLIVLTFIYLGVVAYFIWQDMDASRPDTPRYVELAESICDKSRFYGGNPRGEDELRLAEKQALAERSNLNPMQPEVFRTPGYPVFLCLQDKLGISSQSGKVLVNLAIWFTGIALIGFFFSTDRLGLNGVGISTISLASLGGLVYILTLYSEVLFVFLLIPAYGFIYRYLQTPQARWLVSSALFFSAAFYVRASALYLPLLVSVVLWLALLGRPASRQQKWAPAWFLLIFALALMPWLGRNYQHYGVPYVSAQMSNMLAYWHVPVLENRLGGPPEEFNRQKMHDRVAAAVSAEEARQGRYLNTVEYYQVQQTLAVDELLSTPVEYARYWFQGFWYTLSHGHASQLYVQLGGSASLPDRASFAGVAMRVVLKLERAFWLVVAGLALMGAIRALKHREWFVVLAVLTTLYFMWIPGLMGYPRFRFPAEWLWLLAAGYGSAGLRLVLAGRFGGLRPRVSEI